MKSSSKHQPEVCDIKKYEYHVNHELTRKEGPMFGQRLRLARKRAGLSMRELADAMSPKVTAQAISKYEAGKMLPSSAVLVGLGKALDVSLDFLMSAQVEALDNVVEFRSAPVLPLVIARRLKRS